MTEFRFDALGTVWSITVDEPDKKVSATIWDEVIARTDAFDRAFSRFKEGSEVTKFRHAQPGTYSISAELVTLLQVADTLRTLTNGAHDPAIGAFLEATGYDVEYSFTPKTDAINQWQLPGWSIDAEQQTITIDRGVVFDIGGMGKGYWIDQLSQFLIEEGFEHHLVDGGGDMMATTKHSGEDWRVAIEWPGRQDMALGLVELRQQGFAASDVFRRQWGVWHHLVSATDKQSLGHILGCVAVAPSAWLADQLTAVLPLVDSHQYPVVAAALNGQYLVLGATNQVHVSAGWPGVLY